MASNNRTTPAIFGYRLNAIHGSLPPGLDMQVELEERNSGAYVMITAQGSTNALLASGYLTPSMMAARAARRRGDPRGSRDDHGERYFLTHTPRKGAPERMQLRRHLRPEHAIELPGVREIFPNGIPEPPIQPAHTDLEESGKHELSRADFCTNMLDIIMQCARGDHPTWPEALPTETQCSIEWYVDALREKFRRSGNKRRAPRPSFLRLVIDNTKGDSAHG